MSIRNDYEDGWYPEDRSWCLTQFEEYTGSLTWKIGGFSLCTFKPGEFVTSPDFGIVGDDAVSWKLRLYPHGKTPEKKDCVAVFIHSEKDLMTAVTCEVSIVDASGATTEAKKLNFRSSKNSVGWDEFVSRNILLDKKDLLVPDDELTVRCELATVKTIEENWESFSNRPRIFSCDKRRFKTLSSDMNNILQTNKFTDVVFEVGDKKIFAHKSVLMSRSSVFAAMFNPDVQETQTKTVQTQTKADETGENENNQNRTHQSEPEDENVDTGVEPVPTVVIQDMEVSLFNEMLLFIYTGDCAIFDVQFAMQLLKAADKYDIQSLKTLCSEYLSGHLSVKYVFDVVIRAFESSQRNLLKICIDFICKNSDLVTVHDDWKEKLRCCPEVLEEIVLRLSQSGTRRGNFRLVAATKPNCLTESKAISASCRFVERKGSLLWKIGGISRCPLGTGHSLASPWSLKSPAFGIRTSSEQVKCEIDFYPNGKSKVDEGFISLSLGPLKTLADVLIQFSICIKRSNGETLAERNSVINFYRDYPYSWDKCISSKELFNGSHRNDEIVVHCVLSVSNVCTGFPTQCAIQDPRPNSLAEDLNRLYEKPELADVILDVNGTAIRAHKIILMSRSTFFEIFDTMLNKSETENSLHISDTDEAVFREVLRFMYTDKCLLKDVESAWDILEVAHKYDIPALQLECCRYLCAHMSEENVLAIAKAAFAVKEMELYKNCIDYIYQEVPSFTFLSYDKNKLYSYPVVLNDVVGRLV